MTIIDHTSDKKSKMRIEDWCDQHGLNIELSERPAEWCDKYGTSRYYATFSKNVEVVNDGGTRLSTCGNCDTKVGAVKDLCRQVSQKTVLIGDFEQKVPRLTFDCDGL